MPHKDIIAVIDDEESIRKALMRLLATAGLDAVAFSSAKEFLASAETEHVCCVISDLRMPDIDGLHLQSALAERIPHRGLSFVTGHADVPSTVTAMNTCA